MRRRGFTWFELLIVLVVIGVVAAILTSVFSRSPGGRVPSCISNLKQISMGLAQYSNDYDRRWPPIAEINSPDLGWVDASFPYIKSENVFQCPLEPNKSLDSARANLGGRTDFWLNACIEKYDLSKIRFLNRTLLLGDGNDGQEVTDARYVKKSLPPDWYTDESKPSFRHQGGANYGFADGHVKWLKPTAITTDPPSKTNVTFLPR